ncbi:zinc finger protein OZF-like [Condylostylus longicornis]|uniref:zinc finger protein OZF-like n=1 Tax=Condylostylus longicornis TaxID=2530218 RepID=UPI00244E16C4|nr:zinc finger protein OZF-like [Condylostylus longicornis]
MEQIKIEFKKEFGQKCGELFICSGLLNYRCLFCESLNTEQASFQNHLIKNHGLIFDECINNASNQSCSDENLEIKPFELIHDISDGITNLSSLNVKQSAENEKNLEDSPSEECESLYSEISNNLSKTEETLPKNPIIEEESIDTEISEKPIQKCRVKPLRQLPCPHCDRVYQRPKLLKAHIETHSPGYLTCKICNKTLATKQNLDTHMKIHSEQYQRCPMCPAKFSRKGNLSQHIKRHSKIKSYACKYENCNYKALYPANLRNHEKCHTNLRKEICEICGQTFKEKGHLKEHQKRHNNQRDFQCNKCDKRFYDKKSLAEHENIHTGVKNFVCQVCSVRFSTNRNLRAHMKKHSGVKSYICKYCGDAFYLYSERQYHIKSRHGKPK